MKRFSPDQLIVGLMLAAVLSVIIAYRIYYPM